MTRTLIDLTGQRFGSLVVTGPGEPHTYPNGRAARAWNVRCDCGTETTVLHGNLHSGNTRGCGTHRVGNLTIGYTTAHRRVQRAKGKASDQCCVLCCRPADDWSYSGLDPDELAQEHNGYVLRYSTDPDNYSPLCRQCHHAYDYLMRNAPHVLVELRAT